MTPSPITRPVAVILAAGKGTRMKSDLPKVVHPVAGRPMVCAVVEACKRVGCARVVVVVGYMQEKVREALTGMDVEFAVQSEQLGTGHAVMSAAPLLAGEKGDVLVLAGDGPLIRPGTLRRLLHHHHSTGAAATLATSVIDDPTGYGRVVRGPDGRFSRIVEHKEATPEQKAIREINPSYYCFSGPALFSALSRVTRNASSGEYYLTDVPALMLAEGKRVELVDAVPPEDVLSINTPEELSKVDAIARARRHLATGGGLSGLGGTGGGPLENDNLRIFAGRRSKELAERVAAHLMTPLGAARTIVFPDGEVLVKLEEDVRGRDCFVVLSTAQPVNDNLMELLIFIDCLRRASAQRVTVVIPYFGYGRQDRKDEGRVPITAKLVANLITAAGAHRVMAVDLHAAQIQGFFDLPFDHLTATPVFFEYFMSVRESLGDLCLVSPDVGNVKVAEAFANLLHADLAIINKRRLSGSEVVTGNIIGNVSGKTVLMFDDMISTAGTVSAASRLVMEAGAQRVIVAATHGVLVPPAMERLSSAAISEVVLTNTIPLGEAAASIRGKVTELCVGPLLGEAIRRTHHNESISALFHKTAGTKR